MAPDITEEDYIALCNFESNPTYSGITQLNPLTRWENQGNIPFPLEIEAHPVVLQHPVFNDIVTGFQTFRAKYNRYFVRERFEHALLPVQTEPSWRKTFLSQPPLTSITLKIPLYVGTFKPGKAVSVQVVAQGGITLGLVKDQLEKAMAKLQIKDCRHPAQQRKKKLGEQEYVKGWGKHEFVVYIAKPKKDT